MAISFPPLSNIIIIGCFHLAVPLQYLKCLLPLGRREVTVLIFLAWSWSFLEFEVLTSKPIFEPSPVCRLFDIEALEELAAEYPVNWNILSCGIGAFPI